MPVLTSSHTFSGGSAARREGRECSEDASRSGRGSAPAPRVMNGSQASCQWTKDTLKQPYESGTPGTLTDIIMYVYRLQDDHILMAQIALRSEQKVGASR